MSRISLMTLAPSLARFLRWWRAELRACVPQKFMALLQPERSVLILALNDSGAELTLRRGEEAEALGRLERSKPAAAAGGPGTLSFPKGVHPDRTRVVLWLPSDRALRWRLTVPRAAAGELRQALALQIATRMPFPAEELCFDFRVAMEPEAGGPLTVEVVAALRGDVATALEQARSWGLDPDAVDAAPEPAPACYAPLNLLTGDAHGQSPRKRPWLRAALATVLLTLLATGIALPLYRSHAEAARLEDALQSVRSGAEVSRRLQQEIDTLLDETGFLPLKKQQAASRVQILNDLSNLLPDDTWVSRLSIKENSLRLTGESAGASDLIALIGGSSRFAGARFVAPVTQDRSSGLERFDITFLIEVPGRSE